MKDTRDPNIAYDIFNQETKPGQFILYAVRGGNTASMKVGRVTDVVLERKAERTLNSHMASGFYVRPARFKVKIAKLMECRTVRQGQATFENIENCIVLDELPREAIYKIEDAGVNLD